MSDEADPRDDAPDGNAVRAGDARALETVGELMAERRRYESWLEALEARRAETPKHVFSRVHADYSARLDAVIVRLTTHAEGLRNALTALTTRIANLDEQQHRARDERSEAALRAHVGELSAEAWAEIERASDEEIAALATKRREAEQELERTRALIADAERPATPPQPAAPVPEAATPVAAEPEPLPPDATVAPEPDVPDAAEADLHVPAAPPPQVPAEPASPAAAAPGAPANGFDELAFLHSVVDEPAGEGGTAPEPPPPAAPRRRDSFVGRAAEPKITNTGQPGGPTIEPGRTGRPGLAANISGNNPIVLKDKPAEAAKTLKCGECGAMNYPTEWYCERCGAELASL